MKLRKLRILLRIWKNRGFKVLAARSMERARTHLKQKRASAYLYVKRRAAIRSLAAFSSNDPAEVFEFASNKFLGAIAPGQAREEFVPLLKKILDLRPRVVVEIGTEKGGTFFCFCKLAPADATLASIELPPALFGGGYPTWRISVYQAFAKPNQTLHFIRGDSHSPETLKRLKMALAGREADFLFIDADHTYEGVKKDFEMYAPLVRKGGIVAFHDIVPPYPKEYSDHVSVFWNEIKNRYRYEEFVRDWNQHWGGIGVLYL